MDKNNEAAITSSSMAAAAEANKENEKKSPSFIQQFKTRIAKIEEKFQARSQEKSKTHQDVAATTNMEEGKVNEMKKRDDDEAISSDMQSHEQSKKGLKFGIRVLPANVNEKLFGKSKSKTPSPPPQISSSSSSSSQQQKMSENDMEKLNDVKIEMDQVDGNANTMTTEVTIECENFNRQGSMQSSIKRDANGIPQELPAYMTNAANAAKEGRNYKMGSDAEMRKSKGKAPRPPMISVDLNESTQTMDTNLTMSVADISTDSINNMTANNTNNVNMEIEDELDRITEKYLSQSKDKLNFSDNFGNNSSMMMNNTDGSVTLFDKIEELKDDIDDVILRQREPSNSSTPKCDRKDMNNKDFALDESASDLDLSNYGNCTELNSSDITVHQSNNVDDDVQNDETRRAASLGDLSLMKKSLTEKDGNNTSTLERAQSLELTDNNQLMPKQSLALGLSKPTADLTALNGESDPTIYQTDEAINVDDANKNDYDHLMNKTDQIKMNNYENDVKVIRYPLGTMEREPKSDVLKKILGTQIATTNMQKTEMEFIQNAAPYNYNVDVDASEIVPMSNGGSFAATALKSVVTIENSSSHMHMDGIKPLEVLSIDTDTLEQQPVSFTIINNTIDINSEVDPNHMSPIFSSDNFGVNSIKISSVESQPLSTTLIKNGEQLI